MYEVKFGYRALILKDGDNVRVRSRNDKDLTNAYPSVATAARRLKATQTVVDGEIVAVDANGHPSFQAVAPYRADVDLR
jgi:bifunctional non-homologous end joining protein LigD